MNRPVVPAADDALRRPAGPSGQARRTCIMVLGMHRSGTSALTRVISLLGVALPKTMLGANPTNPTGHWEPLRLIELHDQMLAEAGSSWDDWRAFDLDQLLPRARAEHYRAAIAAIIDEDFGSEPLFVLKEPRLARFVSLYAELFAAMGIDVLYLHTKRNPLAVIRSLEKRDNFTAGYSSLLWLRHELAAERATRGGERVYVSYEQLIAGWRPVVARIDDHLDVAWPRPLDEAAAEIDAYLSREHQHHAASDALLSADPRVPAWVKDAYAALKALGANPQDSQAELVLDRIRTDFDSAAPTFGRAFYDELKRRQGLVLDAERHWRQTADARAAELASLAADTGRQAAEAAALIEQAQQEREALRGELADKEALAASLAEAHARIGQAEQDREAVQRELEVVLQQGVALRQELARLAADLAQREQQINQLEATGSIGQADADRERAKLMNLVDRGADELASLEKAFAGERAALRAELDLTATERDELLRLVEQRDGALAELSESSERLVSELLLTQSTLRQTTTDAAADVARLTSDLVALQGALQAEQETGAAALGELRRELTDRDNEINERERQISDLRRQVASIEAEGSDRLREREAAFAEERDRLTSALAQRSQDAVRSEQAFANLSARETALIHQLDNLTLAREAAETELTARSAEAAYLDHVVNEIRNSTSWRITRPLRALKAAFLRRG